MTWLNYVTAQFRLSQLVYWKRLGIALSGTLVPLGLGIAMPMQAQHSRPIDAVPAPTYIMTGFLAFTLFFTVYNLVNAITSRRDALIYKRLRTTSLPDSAIFTGEGLSAAIPTVAVALVVMLAGIVGMHDDLPRNVPLLVIAMLLGLVMFFSLATGFAGILPSAETSMWIVTPIMVVFIYTSGIFADVKHLPGPLSTIAEFLPMEPLVQLIRTAYLNRDYVSGSTADGGMHLLAAAAGPIGIMIAWTVVGITLARRLFRWDPRRPETRLRRRVPA
ncbi:ABC transporter permease [Nocardia alni]|uniref:ABC transporter permease n=1 Tax=Nocardia alni TaxID=2815723 RepID=UPI001C238A9C|nr:ABC transporter permease [Nocardia alni]